MSVADRATLWEKRGFLSTDELQDAIDVIAASVRRMDTIFYLYKSRPLGSATAEHAPLTELRLTGRCLKKARRIMRSIQAETRDWKRISIRPGQQGEFHDRTLEANRYLYQALASMRVLDRYLDGLGFSALSTSQLEVVTTLIADGSQLSLAELVETAKLLAPDGTVGQA